MNRRAHTPVSHDAACLPCCWSPLPAAARRNCTRGSMSRRGNEMLALLLQQQHPQRKTGGKGQPGQPARQFRQDPGGDGAAAQERLSRRTSSRRSGSCFNSDRLIASPYEDRTRYVYGPFAQELADTLSRVDGVMTARVHIVMPTEDAEDMGAGSRRRCSSSTNPNYDLHGQIPQIKSIVASGIESLDYEAVNVLAVFRRPIRGIWSASMASRSSRCSPSR